MLHKFSLVRQQQHFYYYYCYLQLLSLCCAFDLNSIHVTYSYFFCCCYFCFSHEYLIDVNKLMNYNDLDLWFFMFSILAFLHTGTENSSSWNLLGHPFWDDWFFFFHRTHLFRSNELTEMNSA